MLTGTAFPEGGGMLTGADLPGGGGGADLPAGAGADLPAGGGGADLPAGGGGVTGLLTGGAALTGAAGRTRVAEPVVTKVLPVTGGSTLMVLLFSLNLISSK